MALATNRTRNERAVWRDSQLHDTIFSLRVNAGPCLETFGATKRFARGMAIGGTVWSAVATLVS
jgi:hypothetical protein